VKTRGLAAQAVQQQEGSGGLGEAEVRAARAPSLQRPVLDPAQRPPRDPDPGRLVRQSAVRCSSSGSAGAFWPGAQVQSFFLEPPQ
jgi:hypothetical protein